MVAFAGYPVLVAGRVTGVMALFARHPLTQTTLEALGTVAHSIAHGIDRWRIIEALHTSEERCTLAIQSTDQGIWDWKVLTDEVYLTPRFKELLGYEEHEVESSYSMWESRLHLEDRERVLGALRHHLEERYPFEMDYRLRTKSGEYRWFQARGQTLWDDNNQPIRMVGFSPAQ